MPKLLSDKPIRTFKVTCHMCMCEVEYVPGDILHYTTRDYTGDSDTHYYILCPNPRCKDVKISVRDRYDHR